MDWQEVKRADRRAARLADRHYSRQSVGSGQFTPPGRVMVLLTPQADALWASHWPYAKYVNRKDYKAAWICSIFRNESSRLSSDLIRQAIAATRWKWGEPPADGMITFVDVGKVRRKRDPGRCFRRVGFKPAGETLSGLLILRLAPQDMPAAALPEAAQLRLWPA